MTAKTTATYRKKIILIGGGSSSFLCAYFLCDKHDVHIYEKGSSVGKKFLVAGKGGFNISHQCEVKDLLSAYSPAGFLDEALKSFPPNKLRQWYGNLGIPTFVGSSNRIFP